MKPHLYSRNCVRRGHIVRNKAKSLCDLMELVFQKMKSKKIKTQGQAERCYGEKYTGEELGSEGMCSKKHFYHFQEGPL